VLAHPTSLPGGRLGEPAYAFVDWLANAGQAWWQILPLGPPDEHGSPYRSASAFACSPALLAEPDAPVSRSELAAFSKRHAYWAADWEEFAGPGSLADQVRFEREWSALRRHGRSRGVRLIGDIPIYVSPDGADRLARPELFQAGEVAGVPPDAWSDTGQLWGNPLYDWGRLRATGYRWWVERMRRALELVDVVRIDHFRGFVSYWSVPDDAATALSGRWRRGPGRGPFDAAHAELGQLPVIAEDLGVITPAVTRLREELGFPGTFVLQFQLGAREDPLRTPADRVLYTGTHDNDTTAGWWAGAGAAVQSFALQRAAAAGIEAGAPYWMLLRLALASPAAVVVVPVQDVLGLGSEARMNTPGHAEGNWGFRLEPGALDASVAASLRDATVASGRPAGSSFTSEPTGSDRPRTSARSTAEQGGVVPGKETQSKEGQLTHDEIAARAHEISQRPDGGSSDDENWFRAESELQEERQAKKPRRRVSKKASADE
jgi:4-alpha-glucanotransferase